MYILLIILMKILAIVSCQLGSASKGAAIYLLYLIYVCISWWLCWWWSWPLLYLANWVVPVMGAAIAPPVFLVDRVCELLDATFAYCVQHRPLPIVYFVCFILRSMVMKEWVRRGCRLWTFLIYVTNQNIHLLHCCICILFLYILLSLN